MFMKDAYIKVQILKKWSYQILSLMSGQDLIVYQNQRNRYGTILSNNHQRYIRTKANSSPGARYRYGCLIVYECVSSSKHINMPALELSSSAVPYSDIKILSTLLWPNNYVFHLNAFTSARPDSIHLAVSIGHLGLWTINVCV